MMRLVWATLLLMHLWPLAMIAGRLMIDATLRDLGSLAVLLVLIPLFTLKALDFRLVRTRRPVIEFIVWLVCAGLAHSGPISETPFAKAPAETVVLATVAAGLASRQVRRKVGALLTGLLARSLRTRPNAGPWARFPALLIGGGGGWPAVCVPLQIAARPPPSF